MSSASLFQSPRGRWRSLLIKTGARPLARNSRAKLVATSSFSWPAPLQNPESLFCVVDQLLGAQAIPVVLAEETDAGEPPGPLESVEIIVFPLLAMAEILVDVEVVGQPVDASQQDGRRIRPLPQSMDRVALEVFEALKSPRARR